MGLEEPGGSAARTFPSDTATIGVAYVHRRIVCTLPDADPVTVRDETIELKLDQASRPMDPKVRSVAALPLLSVPSNPQGSEHVTAILYLDSEELGFLNDLTRIKKLKLMCEELLKSVRSMDRTDAGTIANNEFWISAEPTQPLLEAPPAVPASFQLNPEDPPRVPDVPYINFDFSDFQRVSD